MRYQIKYFVENFLVSTKLWCKLTKVGEIEKVSNFVVDGERFFNKEKRQMFFGRTESIPS